MLLNLDQGKVHVDQLDIDAMVMSLFEVVNLASVNLGNKFELAYI